MKHDREFQLFCLSRGRLWQFPKLMLLLGLILLLASLLFNFTWKLSLSASQPLGAVFVLGGSIQREILAANLAKQNPQLPILISQGSSDPCILKIFIKQKASLEKVWLEKCADSTFGNFFFGVPILNKWGVRKVKLVTSESHFPRAKWLGQILFGARGIWVDWEIVLERGVPGNREFALKTGLDVARSLTWAILSQIIEPTCQKITNLANVNLSVWQKRGFSCERQYELQL